MILIFCIKQKKMLFVQKFMTFFFKNRSKGSVKKNECNLIDFLLSYISESKPKP